MLQGIIIKKVMELVMKQLMKQFKLDKIQKYVEQPNDLDKKVKSIEKKLKKLEKLSHPVADFICTDCGTKAKRIKGKINKIKERF
jgi:conjugal transfer/entry exclusion protein